MECLGHLLSHDASPLPCWFRTRDKAWRAYYANVKKARSSGAGSDLSMQLLNRAVLPLVDFRNTRWPIGKFIVRYVDANHRKMVAGVLRTPQLPGEPIEVYVRRRGRVAAAWCREHGQWSRRWMDRVCDWHTHLQQPRNADCWAAQLLRLRDGQWLQGRRLLAGSPSLWAGRTGTRAEAGHVCVRWEQGVHHARDWRS